MRLGAGLVTLGFGVYRLSRGRRDWMTTASLTTGASMLMANMNMGPDVARIALKTRT